MAARFSREDVNTGSNVFHVRLVCKYVLVDSSVTIIGALCLRAIKTKKSQIEFSI